MQQQQQGLLWCSTGGSCCSTWIHAATEVFRRNLINREDALFSINFSWNWHMAHKHDKLPIKSPFRWGPAHCQDETALINFAMAVKFHLMSEKKKNGGKQTNHHHPELCVWGVSGWGRCSSYPKYKPNSDQRPDLVYDPFAAPFIAHYFPHLNFNFAMFPPLLWTVDLLKAPRACKASFDPSDLYWSDTTYCDHSSSTLKFCNSRENQIAFQYSIPRQ